jgi:hypothetical protein
MAEAQPSAVHTKCRCRIIDVFKLEGGRITRDAETESWREMVDPIEADTGSGMVRLGAHGTPTQWDIVQGTGPGWDFIAEKRESGNTVLSTLRIRTWESNTQMVLTVNGFTFATGICEPVHQGGSDALAHRAGTEGTQTEFGRSALELSRGRPWAPRLLLRRHQDQLRVSAEAASERRLGCQDPDG